MSDQIISIEDLTASAHHALDDVIVGEKGGVSFLAMAVEGMARHPYLSSDWCAHNSMYASSFNTFVQNGTDPNTLLTSVKRWSASQNLTPNSK